MEINREFVVDHVVSNKAEQHYDELFWLYKKLMKLNPSTILEIGVRRGGTLKFWDIVLRDIGHNLLIAIDIQRHPEFNENHYKSRLRFLEMDSSSNATKEKVKQILDGREVDLLYIDGAHGYENCKSDYYMYSVFVRKGGIIAFHDTKTEERNVGRFFNELQGKKEKLELGQGTGIIYKE